MKNEDDLRIFLLTLWQQVQACECHGSLFTLTCPTTKRSTHIPAPDFIEALHRDNEYENFAASIEALNAEHDLRVNLGFRDFGSIAARDNLIVPGEARQGSIVRGGRGSVSILPAFSAEFDIGDEGHAAGAAALPKSWEEIENHLRSRSVPLPTLLVRSGHGYHAHWVFENPVYFFVGGESVGNQAAVLNQFRNFQARFIENAPFKIDATAGAEREWRLAGTYNRKIPERPKLVELVSVSDDLFDIDTLSPIKKRRSRRVATRQRELIQVANTGGTPIDHLKAYLAATEPDDALYQPTTLLLDGRVFAQHRRHDTMLELSGRIAWLAESHKLFDQGLTLDDIVSMFLPSFQAWEDEQTADDPTDVEREVRKLEYMIESARDKWLDEQERKQEEVANFHSAIMTQRREEFGDNPLETKGTSIPLIVRFKSEWYVFNLVTGKYEERWFQKDEVIQTTREVWETTPGAANDIIQYQDERGRDKDYTPEKLAERPKVSGVIARSMRLSVKHEASFFDHGDKRFYIAHCPPRPDLDAVYHEEIDEFLSVFGGSEAERLRDWLAVALLLDQPCAALYLEGGPGVGKSLFSQGVASLWGKPATPFENFMGGRRSKFSNIEAPLVLLEEGVSDTHGITSQIRRFITEQNSHSVERKGKDPVFLDGCLRLIIAANNPDAITEAGIRHTHSDSQAIMERIAYVHARPEGREWLEAEDRFGNRLRPPEKLNSWLTDGHFANHIAYLAITREVKRTRLYCAQEEMTDWHVNYLLSTNRVGSYVFEWVARFATDPAPFFQHYQAGKNKECESDISAGRITLRSQEILDAWQAYMSKVTLPSIQDVNSALETLCSREGHNHIVQLDFLRRYIEKNQIGLWHKIEKNLQGLALVK